MPTDDLEAPLARAHVRAGLIKIDMLKQTDVLTCAELAERSAARFGRPESGGRSSDSTWR